MKKITLSFLVFSLTLQMSAQVPCINVGDRDGDGLCDDIDPCPDTFEPNPVDSDGDGVFDECDNCISTPNADQIDLDGDGIGDACDPCVDVDKDTVCDQRDRCLGFDDRIDIDFDGIPDGCDSCIDVDTDGICDDVDDCISTIELGIKCDDGDPCTINDQLDANCRCTGTLVDSDGDGVCDLNDKCPGFDDRRDFDGDGIPDGCDNDATCTACAEDSNGLIVFCHFTLNPQKPLLVIGNCESVSNYFDNEGYFVNTKDHCGPCTCADKGDVDTDGDGVCDREDPCPTDANISRGNCGCDDQDSDGDGVCDRVDKCPGFDDRLDFDGDGIPDKCDELNYCVPDYDNSLEWIQSISIAGREYKNRQSDGFTFYDEDAISLEQGQAYTLEVHTEHIDDIKELSITAYIDRNNNGSFGENGEEILSNRLLGSIEHELKIDDLPVGAYRMRVMVHYGRISDACQLCIDGEVEDILLNIIEPQPCQAIVENFDYTPDQPFEDASGGEGWAGTWQIIEGAGKDFSFLQTSLNGNVNGSKLGILSLPKTRIEFAREVDLSSTGNDEIYLSMFFEKVIGTGSLQFSIGSLIFGLNDKSQVFLNDPSNVKSIDEGVHELVVRIERNNNGEEGISIWIDPIDFDPDSAADLVALKELSGELTSLEVEIVNDNGFLPSVYYVDDIEISCNSVLNGAREKMIKNRQASLLFGKIDQAVSIIASPNPVVGERVNIQIDESGNALYPYHLISFDGKLVTKGILRSGSNVIDIPGMQPGIYTVIVQTRDDIKALRIVNGQ